MLVILFLLLFKTKSKNSILKDTQFLGMETQDQSHILFAYMNNEHKQWAISQWAINLVLFVLRSAVCSLSELRDISQPSPRHQSKLSIYPSNQSQLAILDQSDRLANQGSEVVRPENIVSLNNRLV